MLSLTQKPGIKNYQSVEKLDQNQESECDTSVAGA
jgi:hypothetical protein